MDIPQIWVEMFHDNYPSLVRKLNLSCKNGGRFFTQIFTPTFLYFYTNFYAESFVFLYQFFYTKIRAFLHQNFYFLRPFFTPKVFLHELLTPNSSE